MSQMDIDFQIVQSIAGAVYHGLSPQDAEMDLVIAVYLLLGVSDCVLPRLWCSERVRHLVCTMYLPTSF